MEITKKRASDSGTGWLTTFGDMITLLFTFFVLVYSFCSYSPGQWEAASRSIKRVIAPIHGTKGNTVISSGGMGSFSGHKGVVPLFSDPLYKDEVRWKSFQKAVSALQEQLKSLEGIEVEQTATGAVFRLPTPTLFDRGSAQTKPSAEPYLRAIGATTRETNATITVSGHTCDLPISTADFRSNWELSARRATNVLRGIEGYAGGSVRLVALARGQYAPLLANETEECRAKNRRVEIEIDLRGVLPLEP
jgi:chemotaxis protein MotB